MDTNETLSSALNQLVGNALVYKPREYPGTEKEPVHVKFGKKSHYGEGEHGPHFATWIKDHNVHIDDKGSFIITPTGSAIKVKMNPQIKAALELLRSQTGLMQKKAEDSLRSLVKQGWTPVEAREILDLESGKIKPSEASVISATQSGQPDRHIHRRGAYIKGDKSKMTPAQRKNHSSIFHQGVLRNRESNPVLPKADSALYSPQKIKNISKSASLRDMINKEALQIPLKKGDILLGGRFKNRREVVKTLGVDDNGQFTVNGKKLLNFRIEKTLPDDKKSSQTKKEMEKTSAETMDLYGTLLDSKIPKATISAVSAMLGLGTGLGANWLTSKILGYKDTPLSYALAGGAGASAAGIGGYALSDFLEGKQEEYKKDPNKLLSFIRDIDESDDLSKLSTQLKKSTFMKPVRRAAGRVITNIVKPRDYRFESKLELIKDKGYWNALKAVIKDEPIYAEAGGEREAPYRAYFDMNSRSPEKDKEMYEQITDKLWRLKEHKQTDIADLNDRIQGKHNSRHSLLGGVAVYNKGKDDSYVADPWDFSTSESSELIPKKYITGNTETDSKRKKVLFNMILPQLFRNIGDKLIGNPVTLYHNLKKDAPVPSWLLNKESMDKTAAEYTLQSLIKQGWTPVEAQEMMDLQTPSGLTDTTMYNPQKIKTIGKTASEVKQVGHNQSCALGHMIDYKPSDNQKESENYKKAHVKIDGFNISIENPVGSVRRGMNESGNEWECPIKADYGYIKGSKGYDKDHVDVTIKPSYKGGKGDVYIVNQVDKNGNFDEHKCILGADNEIDAEAVYNSNYEPGWEGCGSIAVMSIDEFRKWVTSEKPRQGEAEVKPLHKIATDYTAAGLRMIDALKSTDPGMNMELANRIRELKGLSKEAADNWLMEFFTWLWEALQNSDFGKALMSLIGFKKGVDTTGDTNIGESITKIKKNSDTTETPGTGGEGTTASTPPRVIPSVPTASEGPGYTPDDTGTAPYFSLPPPDVPEITVSPEAPKTETTGKGVPIQVKGGLNIADRNSTDPPRGTDVDLGSLINKPGDTLPPPEFRGSNRQVLPQDRSVPVNAAPGAVPSPGIPMQESPIKEPTSLREHITQPPDMSLPVRPGIWDYPTQLPEAPVVDNTFEGSLPPEVRARLAARGASPQKAPLPEIETITYGPEVYDKWNKIKGWDEVQYLPPEIREKYKQLEKDNPELAAKQTPYDMALRYPEDAKKNPRYEKYKRRRRDIPVHMEGNRKYNKSDLDAYMAGSEKNRNAIEDQAAWSRWYYKNQGRTLPPELPVTNYDMKLPEETPYYQAPGTIVSRDKDGKIEKDKDGVTAARTLAYENILNPRTYMIQTSTGSPEEVASNVWHEDIHGRGFLNMDYATDNEGNIVARDKDRHDIKNSLYTAVPDSPYDTDKAYSPQMMEYRKWFKDRNLLEKMSPERREWFDYVTRDPEAFVRLRNAKNFRASTQGKVPEKGKPDTEGFREFSFGKVPKSKRYKETRKTHDPKYRDINAWWKLTHDKEGKPLFSPEDQKDYLKKFQYLWDISKKDKKNQFNFSTKKNVA